jgi:hypothetical protein
MRGLSPMVGLAERRKEALKRQAAARLEHRLADLLANDVHHDGFQHCIIQTMYRTTAW